MAGQRLMAGEVAYRIVDLSRVWIEGEVFEPDLPAVQVGQRVSAEFRGAPRRSAVRSHRLCVSHAQPRDPDRAGPSGDGQSGPPAQAGDVCHVPLHGPDRSVLNVPRSAVLVTGKRALVFVRDSTGLLEPREVTLGRARTTDRDPERPARGETVVASATFLVDAESNLGSAWVGWRTCQAWTSRAARVWPPTGAERPRSGGANGPTMTDMPGMNHGGDTARPE